MPHVSGVNGDVMDTRGSQDPYRHSLVGETPQRVGSSLLGTKYGDTGMNSRVAARMVGAAGP